MLQVNVTVKLDERLQVLLESLVTDPAKMAALAAATATTKAADARAQTALDSVTLPPPGSGA
jgi:hypothetical protein